MYNNNLNIFIISEDLVFIQLMEVMLKQYLGNSNIEQFNSYIELTEKKLINPDLIILDDIISGATILEVISYLRLTKKFLSTICFFSNDVYDIKTKAYERGVNYFYSKPFDPIRVVAEIYSIIHKNTQQTSLSY